MTASSGIGFEMVADRIRVVLDAGYAVASLRHFGGGAALAADLAAAVGSAAAALPGPLRAVTAGDPGTPAVILAWRGVTETWLIGRSLEPIAALEAAWAGRADAAVIDLTGGLFVWRLTGERIPDLMARLGGGALEPSPGQALTSRLGELTVMALCVAAGEVLLLADRVYAEHLSGWIRETLADF